MTHGFPRSTRESSCTTSASCGSALRMATARPYRFYASEISYFSGKVRPALRAKRVPSHRVERRPFKLFLATPD
jgi:hypothetical protein